MNSHGHPEVVVVGAGVVGLSTALKIQEKGGYAVTIVADIFPTDPKSIHYTSQWAGAHHVSIAGNDQRQHKMDKETFDVMWKLSEPGGAAEDCFLRLPQVEYYHQEFQEPHYLSWMPNFQIIPKSDLWCGTVAGVRFNTLTIDSPVYLNYLLAQFLAAGGKIVKRKLQHINEVIEGGAEVNTSSDINSKPDAVIICAGLGAKDLGGIEDDTMYPIRGQTVVVRAPWIRFGRTISSKDGLWTYIIPRRSGDVIVGGVKQSNDWYPEARAETTEDILKRGFDLCPELAPPGIRAAREPAIDDVRAIIVEEGCGLRPGRRDSIRLEVVWVEATRKTRVPVVCNYGHGGMGFQSSWGSARIAVDLLESALKSL